VKVTIPGWLVWILGGVVAVVGAILSVLLLRRRAPTPAPVQPTTGEADEATAVDDRARSADAILDAAAATPDPSARRDAVAREANR